MVDICLANSTHWAPFFPSLNLLKCVCRYLW